LEAPTRSSGWNHGRIARWSRKNLEFRVSALTLNQGICQSLKNHEFEKNVARRSVGRHCLGKMETALHP
jgi:hypothetical protein